MRLLPAYTFAAVIGGTLLASPVAAAPDQTPGVALMSATVASSGGLANGVGAVSSQRNSVGDYEVTFVRGFSSKCYAVASPLSSSSVPGVVSVFVSANTIDVETHNTSGVSTDLAFNLIVFCAQ